MSRSLLATARLTEPIGLTTPRTAAILVRKAATATSNGGNKTWSRKADEDKKKSQKELATIIAKALKGQVKKHLASAKKKQKSDDDNEEGECFLVESLTGKLDGFNYDQMESLTLDDEISDEISV